MAIDERVNAHIQQQVRDGVHSVSEMTTYCSSFVKHQLFSGQTLPSRLKTAGAPSRRDAILPQTGKK